MGVRTRGVLCLTNHISGLPLEGCGNERPADSQVCNNGLCENRIEWFTGPWSQVWGWERVMLGSKRKSSGVAKYMGFYRDLTCFLSQFFALCNWNHMIDVIIVCAPVLCRVWRRQPAEVSGVSDKVRRRIHRLATVWVLLPGSAPRPAELQPQGLWSKVVPHWLECCEWDMKPSPILLFRCPKARHLLPTTLTNWYMVKADNLGRLKKSLIIISISCALFSCSSHSGEKCFYLSKNSWSFICL